MLRIRDHGEHEKYKELSALAASGSLSPLELSELQAHLEGCAACREIYSQFRSLTTHGMIALADAQPEGQEPFYWDDSGARERLLARVHDEQQSAQEKKNQGPVAVQSPAIRGHVRSFAKLALAAGLLLAVGLGAFHLGARLQKPQTADIAQPVPMDRPLQQLTEQKRAADELLATQEKRMAQLQAQSSEKEQALAKLRSTLRALEDHSNELTAKNNQSEGQLRTVSQQRDDLNSQLQAMNQAYSKEQTELASLRAERDKTTLHTSSLEAKIEELTTRSHDEDRRLKDAEQYLSSDRDIRELMGARNLYIADVFDVDGSSRTQKPFGRVFYTQGKSLIFYAFDLDHQPGVVNASIFQVWGQREAPQGEQASPMKLGILYMDNESNRRWVMRFDDPKQLAEIDAVFVTVEPRGGSHKPTGKPLLYALLRKEANHP
jgi:hypothetical protein